MSRLAETEYKCSLTAVSAKIGIGLLIGLSHDRTSAIPWD